MSRKTNPSLWIAITFDVPNGQMEICSVKETEQEAIDSAREQLPGLPILCLDFVNMPQPVTDSRISEFLADNGLVGIELTEARNDLIDGLRRFVSETLGEIEE